MDDIGYLFFHVDKVSVDLKEATAAVQLKAKCTFEGPKELGNFFKFEDGTESNVFESNETEAYRLDEDLAAEAQEGNDNDAVLSQKWAADLGIKARSKHLSLTTEMANQLVRSNFKVEVFLGGAEAAAGAAAAAAAVVRCPAADFLTGDTEYAAAPALGAWEKPPAAAAAGGEEGEGAEAAAAAGDTSPGPLARGGATSMVEVGAALDSDLADFFVGGCVLRVGPGVALGGPAGGGGGGGGGGLPEGWGLRAPEGVPRGGEEEHEAVQELLAGPEGKKQEFRILFPADTDGDDPYPIPYTSISGAALLYDVVEKQPDNDESKEGEEDKAAEGEDGEGTPPAPRTVGVWRLEWTEEAALFVPRADFRRLRALAREEGATLPLVVERRAARDPPGEAAAGGKGGGKGGGGAKKGGGGKGAAAAAAPGEGTAAALGPPWRCLVRLPLGAFAGAAAGALAAAPAAPLAPAPAGLAVPGADAEEARERELRRAQGGGAEGAESESEEEAARRAAAVGAARATLRVPLRWSLPLVAAAPAAAEGRLTAADVVPARSVGPAPPARDVLAELRQELDDAILAIAEEYAAMFLGPDGPGGLELTAGSGAGGAGGGVAGLGGGGVNSPGASLEEAAPGDAELRRKQFLYGLTTSGVYHQFKEKLKPRVQRAVRARFSRRPADPVEADRLLGELYAYLMREVAAALQARLDWAQDLDGRREGGDGANPQGDPLGGLDGFAAAAAGGGGGEGEGGDGEAAARAAAAAQARLGELAEDAEAAGDAAGAHRRHEDRVAAADAHARRHAGGQALLQRAWFDYAGFCLRRTRAQEGDPDPGAAADKAAQCLREAVALGPRDADALALYAAVLAEQGQPEPAAALLEAARDLHLPGGGPPPGEEDFPPEVLAERVPPRLHALACLLHDRAGRGRDAREGLALAVRATLARGYVEPPSQRGAPRRTAVAALQALAGWLVAHGLRALAARALALARASEELAARKARERRLPAAAALEVREAALRLASALALAEGRADEAEDRARAAAELAPRSGAAHLQLGDALWGAAAAAGAGAGGGGGGARPEEAARAYAEALRLLDPAGGRPEPLREENGRRLPPAAAAGGGGAAPLRLFLRLGELHRRLGRLAEAQETYLRCCQVRPRCPSGWLGAGVAALRRGLAADAEACLQRANLLDHRAGAVWGHLALLALQRGERAPADRALDQALRFEVADPALLRELATALMAVDRLPAAERLLRRALALPGQPAAHRARARKLLADVAAAQNLGDRAVEDYRAVAADADAAAGERREARDRALALLGQLGREDEAELFLAALEEGGLVD